MTKEDLSRPAWTAMTEALRPLSGEVAERLGYAHDAAMRAETDWMLLTAMGQYVVNFRALDPDNPQFTPLLNSTFNQGAPVPDYMYQFARIDCTGAYRISGRRGTSLFVQLQQMTGLDGIRATGKGLGQFEIDDLAIDAQGRFSVILSPERPSGYDGDWRPMDAGATNVMVRHACADWLVEVDAQLAIERLDRPARGHRREDREVDAALAGLPLWVRDRTLAWSNHVPQKRAAGQANTLVGYDVSHTGGMAGQVYLEGTYDLAENEVLIVETEVPETFAYWSILVTNDVYATIDWTAHQSSLNHVQARVDSDGRFRAVISPRDPGVANWVDTGGYLKGGIQFRWTKASSAPMPTVRLVKWDEIAGLLPADTPRVSPEERDQELRRRREGAQLRRRW